MGCLMQRTRSAFKSAVMHVDIEMLGWLFGSSLID